MSDKTTNARDRIIVALDTKDPLMVRNYVTQLAPVVGCFKVGLELITSIGGPEIVRMIHDLGGQVFYDGKFCDIPNTVGEASKAASNLGVKMFNVHANCGIAALRAAVENKGKSWVLAVTVLTSLSDEDSQHLYGDTSFNTVLLYARDAAKALCDGIVCSPQELTKLNKDPKLVKLKKITPGVRPYWASLGDQKRVMTPAEAIKAGATALVIGRPILRPPAEIGSPVEAAKRILAEIEEVL